MHTASRCFVLLIATTLLSLSLWAVFNLKQYFHLTLMFPRESYIYEWSQKFQHHFPENGESAFVYFEDVNIPEQLPELRRLADEIESNEYVSSVHAWFQTLPLYMSLHPKYFWSTYNNLTAEEFEDALGLFLHSSTGYIYRTHFQFEEPLSCLEPVPPFHKFAMYFEYHATHDKEKQIQGMDDIREIVASANLTGYRSVWSLGFFGAEMNLVITNELLQNLCLVSVMIIVMTLLLLASLKGAVMVLVSVIASLISIGGLMYVWDVYVDVTSGIALTLSVGLCVDFSAHITHAFLSATGTRRERAMAALMRTGPAVFHGGISTLIAFLPVFAATMPVYTIFVKVYLGVIIFGLFNGLAFTPVVLSLVGPEPYGEGLTEPVIVGVSSEDKTQSGEGWRNVTNTFKKVRRCIPRNWRKSRSFSITHPKTTPA